jgi:hypothetical protein
MRAIIGSRLAVAVMAATLASPGALLAAAGWEEDLTTEIDLTRHCKVAYLSHVVERTVDGRKLVMAKVHCEDKRVFDALRPDELEPFRFNECQPEAVQAC